MHSESTTRLGLQLADDDRQREDGAAGMQERLEGAQRQLESVQQKQQQLADTIVQQRDLIRQLRGQVCTNSVPLALRVADAADVLWPADQLQYSVLAASASLFLTTWHYCRAPMRTISGRRYQRQGWRQSS